jgi:hypothetical protein
VLESQRTSRIPRNQYGIPYADALDPANNPYAPDATGHFIAEPIADFSAAAIEAAKEARKKAVGNDDWPLVWTARLEKFASDSPEGPA